MLEKLYKLGAIKQLGTGTDGIRVSLQYEPRITEPSRSERRSILHDEFQRVAESINKKGAEVDLNSISVSGQTVEAVLPISEYDEILDDLSTRGIRMDLLYDRQVI